MARGVRRVATLGSVVLDSQGLSLLIEDDRTMTARVDRARSEGIDVIISSLTILESGPAAAVRGRRDWVLSRLAVEPVSKEVALHAAGLLQRAGMSGHKHAVDSVVAATALRQLGPVALYTSDPDDLTALCSGDDSPAAGGVAIIRV
jgi:hypothetical protein